MRKTNRQNFLRPDEISRLFAGLKYDTASALRAAAMVYMAYFLGMRLEYRWFMKGFKVSRVLDIPEHWRAYTERYRL